MTENNKNSEPLETEEKLNPHKVHYEIARLLMYQGVDKFKFEDSDTRYTFMGSDPGARKIYYTVGNSGPVQNFNYSEIAKIDSTDKNGADNLVLLIKKCVD